MKRIQNLKLAAMITAFTGISGLSFMTQAGTSSNTFTVSLEIAKSCTVSATPIDFGSSPGQVISDDELTGSTDVTVDCGAGADGEPYIIQLAYSGNKADASTPRMVHTDGDLIPYQFFDDAGRTAVRAEATDISGTTDGSGQEVTTIFAEVGAGTYAKEGAYQDTVTVNISW